MTTEKKIKILWLIPGFVYRPDLPNYTIQLNSLSDKFEGEIYSCVDREEFKDFKIGSFTFRGACLPKSSFYGRVFVLLFHILRYSFKYNREHKVDVIVCYDPAFTGFIGALLKYIFGCKLVIEINTINFSQALKLFGGSGIITRLKIAIGSLTRRFSLWSADAIKLLSETNRQSFDFDYKNKIYVFNNLIPIKYFIDADNRMDKYILFVGYPFYLKGVDVLIKAFELITDQFPDFELHLIGHQLEVEAKRLLGTWHPRVKFFKGMYYDDQLRQQFVHCHCFVIASRTEGVPRVLIEAWASGKPVIGTRVGGIPDLIEDGKNGFLVEPDNIEELSKQLAVLLGDPQLAHEMGERGRQFVQDQYSTEKYLDNFQRMIGDIIAD